MGIIVKVNLTHTYLIKWKNISYFPGICNKHQRNWEVWSNKVVKGQIYKKHVTLVTVVIRWLRPECKFAAKIEMFFFPNISLQMMI